MKNVQKISVMSKPIHSYLMADSKLILGYYSALFIVDLKSFKVVNDITLHETTEITKMMHLGKDHIMCLDIDGRFIVVSLVTMKMVNKVFTPQDGKLWKESSIVKLSIP